MARSPSGKRFKAAMLALATSTPIESANSAEIKRDRRTRSNAQADGMGSPLGNPRLESKGAESAGHARWRRKAKNLSKPFNRTGPVTKPV